jgi:hypothetical protein
MVVVWAALFLPGFFRPAHEIVTCNFFACSHVPESQYFATLYLATGTLLGVAAVFFGLAFMAPRISQARMRAQWHLFPGSR